jgi:putative ABC transport system permease protein
MLSDVRHALRLMRRSPALTAVALASVAIGTSASAVVFAAVKAVLLQPLPYAKASELVELRTDFQRGNPREDWVSWSDAKDAVERGASFDSSGTYHYAVFNLAGDSHTLPEALYGLTVSASLFPALGVKPILGRNILPEEDQPQHACVMILSYGLWTRRFDSDRSIVGRSVPVNGHACTIAGVMPPEFNFPLRLATTVRTPSPYIEFWAAPLPRPGEDALRRRDDFGYGAVARLKNGVTAVQASQELARISAVESASSSACPLVGGKKPGRFAAGPMAAVRRGRIIHADRLRQRRESFAGSRAVQAA